MSLSTALLPDRRPGRKPTQGSRPDPHHQPTEAPPSNPTCTRAVYPHEHHHSPYASLRRSPARQNSPRARLGRVGPATRRCGARVLLVRACTLVTSVSSRAVSSRAVSSRTVAPARPSGGPARWVCPSLRFAVLAVAPPSCSPPARCDSSPPLRRVVALLAYPGLVPRRTWQTLRRRRGWCRLCG